MGSSNTLGIRNEEGGVETQLLIVGVEPFAAVSSFVKVYKA
jgi:hypothetical protein